MKVYVITKGCYSDYHICCIVADKLLAENLVEKYSDDWDEANVEEYDTEIYNHEAVRFKNRYCVAINPDSSVDSVERISLEDYDDDYILQTRDGIFYTVVFADDEKGAIKTAMDKRAKYLAEKMGL